MKKRTALIHGVSTIDDLTNSMNVPIYQTSTFKQEEVGVHKGYEYARTHNPTRSILEKTIAYVEEGKHGFAFSSGLAAITTVFSLFKAGDHIVFTDDLYGGTYRLMTKVFQKFGLEATFVSSHDLEAIEKAITPQTVAIYTETPTNPLLHIVDIKGVSDIARKHGLLTIVDNTFLTPYFQNPISLGADIVLHSATKYLAGHSDVVAGLVVVKEDTLGEQLSFYQNAIGAVLGPQDSFLVIRGMKTLGIRMDVHERNALGIARYLENHEKVKNVYFPGLPSHHNHELAKIQSSGFGGMISFELNDGIDVHRFLGGITYFTIAESLGAVESLISVPALMTHASIPKERRQEIGIRDGVIRISVGIEDVEDLIEDLEKALRIK